jgi:hypothetical protein
MRLKTGHHNKSNFIIKKQLKYIGSNRWRYANFVGDLSLLNNYQNIKNIVKNSMNEN